MYARCADNVMVRLIISVCKLDSCLSGLLIQEVGLEEYVIVEIFRFRIEFQLVTHWYQKFFFGLPLKKHTSLI